MKRLYQAGTLAALGLAGAMTARADSYDLLVGCTVQSGNGLIYDLGPVESYGSGSGLFNRKTRGLGSLLSAHNLNPVPCGVVGDANSLDGFDPQATWVTTGGKVPTQINGGSAFDNVQAFPNQARLMQPNRITPNHTTN